MMRAEIAKTFTFEAAHRLSNHDGKCAHPHGHSYRVEVAVEGDIQPAHGGPDEGMVMDFARISQAWKVHLEPLLDHRDLNETLGAVPTTAENIAAWIGEKFIYAGVPPTAITLWETPTCRATVRFP